MSGNTDRRAREVFREVYAAWDANDAKAFARPRAVSATATLPGIYLSGSRAMATLSAGDLRGSRAVYEVREIRFVTGGVAIVTSKGAVLLARQGEPAAASRALETWVPSRRDGAWRVDASRNCPEQVNRDAQ
jgi:uncharacterized protein (TIGR02246 family)